MILKVCGMKEHSNILQLAEVSPDWMGMIFYEKSPRHVDQVVEVNNGTKKIGVFVNASNDYIDNKIATFGLVGVQLHGQESPAFCESYHQKGMIVLKAFSISNDFDFEKTTAYETACNYFVFDTKGKNPGGNGMTYDWNILQAYKGNTPFLLSGGISPELVDSIKQFQHPKCAGIDINSGFEIKPGLKDIALIKKFKHDLSN